MGLSIGIVGLPNVGKSTLFNALSAAGAQAANYPFCTIEPNVGVVPVPDPRLERIAALYKPRKVTPTSLTFVDIAGLVRGASQGQGLGNQFLANIREADAIAHVLRCFVDPNVIHVDGAPDPTRDAEIVDTELCLKDLECVEKRKERAQKNGKAAGKPGEEARAELETLERVGRGLDAGVPVRAQPLSAEDRARIAELWLLTQKPVLIVANIAESQIGRGDDPLVQKARAVAEKEGAAFVSICGQVEAEILELPSAERGEFLKSVGLEEPGLDRLVHAGYTLLGLCTFFTGGQEELPRLDHSRGDPRAAGGGGDPHRLRARVRQGGGDALGGPGGAGERSGGAREGADAHRGEGVRGAGRGCDLFQVRDLTTNPAWARSHSRSRLFVRRKTGIGNGIGIGIELLAGCEMTSFPFMRSLMLFFLFACADGTAPPGAPDAGADLGPWREAAPLPRARQELAVAVLEGRIWAAGGLDAAGHATADFAAYLPSGDAWSDAAPLPEARDHLGLVAAAGAIWVVGGGQAAPARTLFRYDPTANSWTRAPDLPEARAAAAVAAAGSTILVMGGSAAPGALAANTLIFDITQSSWGIATPITTPREHTAGALFESHPFALGGRTSAGDVTAAEFLDSAVWVQAFPIPAPARSGACAAVFQGALWYLGGESPREGRAFADAHRLSSSFAGWQPATDLPFPLHGHGCAAVDGKLFVIGGAIRAGLAPSARVFVLE